jgi:amino acid transporter
MEIIEIITTIILAVMVVIGVISAFLALKRRKEDKSAEPNYRVFYITGLILLPIGIIWIGVSFFWDISFVVGIPFLGVAATYIIIGLAYRDKWKK